MYRYRSKCRWNMLLHIGGEIREIRPTEILELDHKISSRYLEFISENNIEITKKGRPKKKISFTKSIEAKNINANSSSTQS